MKVTIVGTGYVGLTTGVSLAYLGHKVTCLDVNQSKINLLKEKKSPIYEPHLEELMDLAWKNLNFTTRFEEAIPGSDVVFIAVGTPSLPDGNPDLSYVRSAAQAIGENLTDHYAVVINKSTVPIGSGNWVDSIVRDAYKKRHGNEPNGRFAVASNPEFLREGSALHDTFYADRIVVGSDSSKALETLYSLYKPILEQTFSAPNFLSRPEGLGAVPFITTNLASAELIKYAANAFLALKISYINEIAQLAERVGADITQIAKGIGLDARIGTRFLQAGIGWGGSCFAKDTSALVATAGEYGISLPIVNSAREVNIQQRGRIVEKVLSELKILKGRTIGLLGLAFKPHTDDLRDAPALDIAKMLIDRGAKVKAHDPIALEKAKKDASEIGLILCSTPLEVAEEADAVILVTEWPQYRELNWAQIHKTMRNPFLLDGRNFLDQEQLVRTGFKYLGIGK
ncbi:MAG: UDP-glucose/GDP-mannose dehydrogenase family protein [bacterium]